MIENPQFFLKSLKVLQIFKFKLPSFKDSAFGWDGLSTFIFSNFLMLVTLGMFFFWLLFRVIQIAMTTKTTARKTAAGASGSRVILIAGLCLQHNQLTEEFKSRLDRAIALEQDNSDKDNSNDRIIILGGLTGGNQISEARAGADYLIELGVAAKKIILEEQSCHTLENMQHARALLLNATGSKAILTPPQRQRWPENRVIISSRYHLYRAMTLAKGLKMTLQPIAAEQSFVFTKQILFRMIKEAYYLHWYWSGKIWVFITAKHKNQARIS